MFNITVNGQSYYTNAEPDTPLLWVLREELGLNGTKFGCGRGICGACSIHINGEAIRSCQIRVEDAVGKTITTIEGLGEKNYILCKKLGLISKYLSVVTVNLGK